MIERGAYLEEHVNCLLSKKSHAGSVSLNGLIVSLKKWTCLTCFSTFLVANAMMILVANTMMIVSIVDYVIS
jgi:hypothetical protein